jgi:hypothetical protein
MHSSSDKMIAALEAFNAGPRDDHAVSDLYSITEGFDNLPDKARVIPEMFAVIERCAEADLGNPGPLVHCIESLGYQHYLSQLVDSVNRQPTYLNVWMVNRILNTSIQDIHRQQLLELLRSVAARPATTAPIADQAKRDLEHQERRTTKR